MMKNFPSFSSLDSITLSKVVIFLNSLDFSSIWCCGSQLGEIFFATVFLWLDCHNVGKGATDFLWLENLQCTEHLWSKMLTVLFFWLSLKIQKYTCNDLDLYYYSSYPLFSMFIVLLLLFIFNQTIHKHFWVPLCTRDYPKDLDSSNEQEKNNFIKLSFLWRKQTIKNKGWGFGSVMWVPAWQTRGHEIDLQYQKRKIS